MDYIIGIDGGGTRTTAILATPAGEVRATAHSGPANYLSAGRTAAQTAISSVIEDVIAATGVAKADCRWICCGLAAIGNETDRQVYADIVRAVGLGGDILIESDVVIAWAASTGGAPGVALIAGTGSSCFGVNAQGERYRALGWDYVLADQGSGYWIGLQGLQAAFKAYDGRLAHTALLDAMVQHYDLANADEMLALAYATAFTKGRIASFAQAVSRCAVEGDATAQAILATAGAELGAGVVTVARQLNMMSEAFPVGLIGGTFSAGEAILAPLRAALAPCPGAALVFPPYPPVYGALVRGTQVHEALSPDFLAALAVSYRSNRGATSS